MLKLMMQQQERLFTFDLPSVNALDAEEKCKRSH